MTEILAAVGAVTALVVLLLVAVNVERVTRLIAVLRHTRQRYTEPLHELRTQTDRMATWREQHRAT